MNDYTGSAVYERLQKAQQAQQGGAKVAFKYDGIKDESASQEAGRPIYKTIEIIEMKFDNGREIVLQVNPNHIAQFPDLYKAFKNQDETPEAGTPLKEWSLITRNTLCELTEIGVRTVEELSACDGVPQVVDFYGEWIEKAKTWLESAKSPQNVVTGLKKKIATLEKTIEDLQNKNITLVRQLNGKD